MKFAKIFKLFKKGSKAAAGRGGKGKSAGGGFEWPSGIRIGIYGHANAGKTVYYTVLNEECKISKNLQISVTDNMTAGEFLTNYRAIWGLGTASDAGTVVDMRGERKFPEPTVGDKLLQFNAIVDRKKKLNIVTFDYNGKATSISQQAENAEKVADFMAGCHGILFFFDPKIMGAELETQAHVASFVNMLERLTPLTSRLPIPIALVITKADILKGFTGEDQVILVDPEDEYIVSEDFEFFLDKVLSNPKIAANAAWSGSVRSILVKLKDFLRVVVGRTLDFQIFFTSCTGTQPEKIGSDIGRSIYQPPKKMSPVGVREPFYWLLNSIIRNRRISKLRKIAGYAAAISLIWIILFSIPFIFHFAWLHDKPQRIEADILKAYDGNVYNTSDEERRRIINEYQKYERSKIVKWFFEPFLAPAQRIRIAYTRQNQQEAIAALNANIKQFASIVSNQTLWPTFNPSDSAVILNDTHKRLIEAFQSYHKGDENSILYTRSGRALVYWDLFTKAVATPSDTTVWKTIQQQVQTDRSLHGNELSPDEIALGDALSDYKVKKVKKVAAQKAVVQLDDIITKINGNDSPAYRLGDAVDELKQIRKQLDPGNDAKSIQMIDRYISRAAGWQKDKTFSYKVANIPGDGHIHIEVTERGKDPTWSEETQILAGFEYKLRWKIGDQIHVAIDTLGQECTWGKTASDRAIFKGRYSIFDMENGISFDNIGKKVEVRFQPGLKDLLPELK